MSAVGDIDACNGRDLAACASGQSATFQRLILDLSAVTFFGTQGFSALHEINVGCSRRGAGWIAVPGNEVRRLLRICDPAGILPTAATLEAAMAWAA